MQAVSDNLEFYLVDEVAQKLRVNKMTIYRYIKAGRLDAFKFGKEFRIKTAAFEQFLKKHQT